MSINNSMKRYLCIGNGNYVEIPTNFASGISIAHVRGKFFEDGQIMLEEPDDMEMRKWQRDLTMMGSYAESLDELKYLERKIKEFFNK